MRAARTSAMRHLAYREIRDGEARLKAAMLRYLAGIRGERRRPLTLDQVQAWFAATPPALVREALHALARAGEVRIEHGGGTPRYRAEPLPFAVRHFYPDGALLEAQRFGREDKARAEFDRLAGEILPGETVVLIGRGAEIDRFRNCAAFARAS